MKILLTLNKTYRGHLDGGYWYVYLPLQQMGHDVYLYDTVNPEEKDYNKVIESFKPDLIFCCLTNDRLVAPHEPWEQLLRETQLGRTKTFNWFCDDTWRFETFSQQTCHFFHACSTPEPSYLQKYKEIGYNNIILGTWHANLDLYPAMKKDVHISFMGALNGARQHFVNTHAELAIQLFSGLSHDEMMTAYARSHIGINLSINDNDPLKQTQMKQRIFEITAANSLLLTQHHEGIEEFFDIDKEIITFKSDEEFSQKASFLIKNNKISEKIAAAGHKRFLAEHESKIRLTNVLQQIRRI